MVKRAPNLTETRVEGILSIIRGWEGRLTWSALIDAVADRQGGRYTRQALHKHDRIRVAMETHRAGPVVLGSRKRPVSVALQAAQERLSRLEHEVREMKARETLLLHRFAKWAYNASIRGMTERMLDQDLPPVRRN